MGFDCMVHYCECNNTSLSIAFFDQLRRYQCPSKMFRSMEFLDPITLRIKAS